MNPGLLEDELGSAGGYTALLPTDLEAKAQYKERIKQFSIKLASLSGLVKIRFIFVFQNWFELLIKYWLAGKKSGYIMRYFLKEKTIFDI